MSDVGASSALSCSTSVRLTGDAMCVEALSPPFVHTTDFVCDPRTVHTNGSSADGTHIRSQAHVLVVE